MDTENKLIAEFMGLETSDGCYFEHLTKEGKRELTHYILLEYHISWDWLMPVVEQIENFGFEFIIAESRVKIKHNTDYSINELLNIDIVGTKIDATYKAVMQFIKQYQN
jgi:hypothetical protein